MEVFEERSLKQVDADLAEYSKNPLQLMSKKQYVPYSLLLDARRRELAKDAEGFERNLYTLCIACAIGFGVAYLHRGFSGL